MLNKDNWPNFKYGNQVGNFTYIILSVKISEQSLIVSNYGKKNT